MVKNGRKLDPDNKITFWGPYKRSNNEEGFFFGTHDEFWTYMGYNKEPQQSTISVDTYLKKTDDGINKLVSKGKLFDIR